MNILIIGNGGREHALAWKAAQSPIADKIFVAPGNAGTAQEPKVDNIDIAPTDIPALIEFAKHSEIALTIVGPEAPLALGIVDAFQAEGLTIFGPTKACAELESSKAFSKNFMKQYGIPTAAYGTFTDAAKAKTYLETHACPIVIKASGLAAGKGVVIAKTHEEANAAIDAMLCDHQFGEASAKIVIEEFLEGEELSFMVMCDGTHYQILASSQDHKARDNGDTGPNTGGMGAYSPAPILDDALTDIILKTVVEPTLKALKDSGTPYTGFLYAGLMVNQEGHPKLLEFNCRLGDPETQVILMRLQSDLVAHCLAATKATLDQEQLQWDARPALNVVLCAGGYPFSYNKGETINGLEQTLSEDEKIFHAGTKNTNGQICTNGGRVLSACALGKTIEIAQANAYTLANRITWPSAFYRNDIGYRAIKRRASL
jgi:phosphoribosylamine--glycine ligase